MSQEAKCPWNSVPKYLECVNLCKNVKKKNKINWTLGEINLKPLMSSRILLFMHIFLQLVKQAS